MSQIFPNLNHKRVFTHFKREFNNLKHKIIYKTRLYRQFYDKLR